MLSFVLFFAAATFIPGGGHFDSTSVEAIEGSGLIKLQGTTVLQTVHVSGSLLSQNGNIGSLDVMGDVHLTDTHVKGGGTVMGSMHALRSTIEAPLILFVQRATFIRSKLAGITVKQDNGFRGKQILELKSGTLVDGPIHFESGKGEIFLYPGSQVLGTVTGGKIVKKN